MLWEGIMHTGGIWRVVVGNRDIAPRNAPHGASVNARVGSESGCVTVGTLALLKPGLSLVGKVGTASGTNAHTHEVDQLKDSPSLPTASAWQGELKLHGTQMFPTSALPGTTERSSRRPVFTEATEF